MAPANPRGFSQGEIMFIRSYNDYAHKFSFKGGFIVIPSKYSKPNVIEVSDEQFEFLSKNDEFNAILNASYQQFKIVDKIPRDQLDVMSQIAQARDDAQAARDESEKNRREADKAKQEIETLKREIEENGGGTAESESVRLAKEETEQTKKDLEKALAELAELKAKKKVKPE